MRSRSTRRSFPAAWWTLVTYMFVHAGLWHLAFNMFTLWMFGPRVEQVWGTRGFHLLLSVVRTRRRDRAPVFSQGTRRADRRFGAISGVLLAYALSWPDEEVYLFGVIPMKIALARRLDGR